MSRLTDAQKLAQRLDRATRRLEDRRRERRATGGDTTEKSRTSSRSRASANPDRSDVLGSPFDGRNVITGESFNDSRGFQFSRLIGNMLGIVPADCCKEEYQVSREIEQVMNFAPGFQSHTQRSYGGAPSLLAPFCPALMCGSPGVHMMRDRNWLGTLNQKMWSPVLGADPDEINSLTKKAGLGSGNSLKSWVPDSQKAAVPQSWMQQEYGGALVPPPEWGPFIPLLRNQAAILNAGATVQPLPPGGRIVMPRQTTASTVGHTGEGQSLTQTNVQTDQFELSPKLIGATFVVNNQLLKFGGPAVEQMLRNDLTLSLSLQMDFDCLQGAGSNNVIAGLIGYPGVQSYTGAGAATNGNAFQAIDVYNMRAKVFAANAPEFTSWIIHPLLAGAISGARAGSGIGANTGPFLYDITRGFEDGVLVERLALAKLVQSTNAPTNRVKGSGTTLTTVYGGWWPNYIVGMYGTIELAIAEQGTPYFASYQTQLRGVLQADAGPRNAGAFIYYDQVLNTSPVS